MLTADTYRIRTASSEDVATLNRLAASQTLRPLHGEVLIGERDGSPVAALSLNDGRVIADDAPDIEQLVANLRTQAIAVWAAKETGVSGRWRGEARSERCRAVQTSPLLARR